MSKFLVRLLSGLVFVSVLIFAILYSKFTFILLFFFLMMFCLYEFTTMIKVKSSFPYIIGVLTFIYGNVSSIDGSASKQMTKFWGMALFLAMFSTFVSILFSKKEAVVSHLGKIFLSVIYIVIPFTLIVQIPFLNSEFDYINTTILGVFILIWINDSFAFLIGKNFGKHKLFERVSPNKTIEGFIGGMVFTFIGSYFLSKYLVTNLSLEQWLVIAGIVSVFGVLGDLIESMFKRNAGVKDSSNFIPGHGGFLDRFDSVIFAAPFIFIYLQLLQ